jgi:glycosyltransferase involved in cell wall biosynthesis
MAECLDCVASAGCEGIEHVIVDGGSSDRTVEIVRDFTCHHPHVRLFSKPGTNQSAAMNHGITVARGQVLGFLNVDDFYEPHTLRFVQQAFKTLREPTLLVGNCNVLGDDGKLLFVNRPRNLRITHILVKKNNASIPVNPVAYFYHASLHKEIGLYTTEDDYIMDLDFIFRAVRVARVRYMKETLGNFRLIKGTKTYNDNVSRLIEYRYEKLLERHYQRLPKRLQWLVKSGALCADARFALRRGARAITRAFDDAGFRRR